MYKSFGKTTNNTGKIQFVQNLIKLTSDIDIILDRSKIPTAWNTNENKTEVSVQKYSATGINTAVYPENINKQR